MIKLVYCVRRKAEISEDEFYRYWLEEHGQLVKSVARVLRAKRYVQSHTLADAVNEPVRASRGTSEPYDGITEVWFESLEAMGAGDSQEAIDAAQQLLEDEGAFIDFSRSSVFLTQEHEIF